MTKRNFIITLLLLSSVASFASGNRNTSSARISVKDYIRKWAPVAQKHMKEFRIPASIILAQGILESGYGNSSMAKNANNHFGIKCLGWKGAGYYQKNSERQCYRKYPSTEECFKDHARILTSKSRYAFLFRLNFTDYRSWALGLKKAGYAQDPAYDQLLISTIEEYQLYAIDRAVAGTSHAQTKEEKAEAAKLRQSTAKPKIEVKIWDQMSPMNGLVIEQSKPEITSVQLPEPILELMAVGELEEDSLLQEVATEEVSSEWLPEVNLRYLIIDEEISLSELAKGLEIPLQDLLYWNDLDGDQIVKVNTRIFLQEKSKSGHYIVCTARKNQNLWDVSQIYGLKLRHLEHLNHLSHGEQPVPGSTIRLK